MVRGVKRKIVGLVALLLWAACSSTGTRSPEPVPARQLFAREQPLAPRAITATPPPPPHIDPPRPPDPGGNALWRAGHYQFRNGRYLWIPGAWVVPPRAGLEWVPGFYKQTREGGLYINGHWRKT